MNSDIISIAVAVAILAAAATALAFACLAAAGRADEQSERQLGGQDDETAANHD